MDITPMRFGNVHTNPGWATNKQDAICFSVNQSDMKIGGAAVFLTNQQVGFDMTLELLELKDDVTDQSQKGNWNVRASIRKTLTFAHQESTNFKYPVEFANMVSIKANRNHAMCLTIHTTGYNTCYGQQGKATVTCSDGAVFTFSNCAFSQNSSKDGGQIPSILYTRNTFTVSPSRFGSVHPSGVALDGMSGGVNAVSFSVNEDGLQIFGAGVFVTYSLVNYNVTLELLSAGKISEAEKQQKQKWTVLAMKESTVTYNLCNSAPVKVLFDKSVQIKKDQQYAFCMTIKGSQHTYFGQNGKTSLDCGDGVTITFANCPIANNNSNTNQGQIPCVLFTRGDLPSYQRLLFREVIPLKQETFSEESSPQQLNRYCFSLKSSKTNGKLAVQLLCRPVEEEENWSIDTTAQLLLLHPKDRKKRRKWEAEASFKNEEKAKALLEIEDLLKGAFAGVDSCSLHVELRYTKASEGPSYVEKELTFDKPWKRSDVDFVFDDERHVYCHKSVLALASPVFETMLFGSSKEEPEKGIPLPGKDRVHFIELLMLLYPRETPRVFTEESAYNLAELCHEYQIKRLGRKAEDKLLETTTEETALRSLNLAFKCEFEDLKEKAVKEAMKLDTTTIEEDWFFFQLDSEVQVAVKEAKLRCYEA